MRPEREMRLPALTTQAACGVAVATLLHRDAGRLDDLAPLLALGNNEGSEFLRRVADHTHAAPAELLKDRRLHGFGDFGVQALDDRRRRTGRGNETEPGRRLPSR